MDTNKTILSSVISIVIGACICCTGFIYYKYLQLNIEAEFTAGKLKLSTAEAEMKQKGMEMAVYNSYTTCLHSSMQDSRDNGKPCDIKEAERICSKR